MKDLLDLIPNDVRNNKEHKKYTVLDHAGQHKMTFTRNELDKWALTKAFGIDDPEVIAAVINNGKKASK